MSDTASKPGSDRPSPLVAVGMPVYNGELWLAAAIESILAQSFVDFELVICDNASTDGTRAICEDFAARDARVRYSRNEANIGLFRNYNRVFELTNSRYFKWASSNDVCGERLLETCVTALENAPDAVLAYPKTAIFAEQIETARDYEDSTKLDQETPSERVRALLAKPGLNNVINGVLRSDVLRKTALNRIFVGSDITLVAELAMHGKFIQVPERLFYRRMTETASSVLVPEAERSEYFAHEPHNVFALYHWKRELGFFAALARVHMAFAERRKIAWHLISRLVRNRGALLEELFSAFRLWGSRSSQSEGY